MKEMTTEIDQVAGGFGATDFGFSIGYAFGSVYSFGVSAIKNYNADWAL